MKLRMIFVLAVGAVTFGLAQNTVQSAFGRGTAANANNVRGNFDFEVTKRRGETGEPVIRGRLTFRSENTNEHVVAEINMTQIRSAGFTNTKVCEFGGAAVLVRRRAGSVIRNEGRIAVRVQDRRIEGVGEPDLFRIQFFSPANVELYRFDGRVVEGNLTVRLQ